jgi:hypothetical protein
MERRILIMAAVPVLLVVLCVAAIIAMNVGIDLRLP